MSLALAAFGLKAAGSIFGGLSARKAAKRKAAFQKKQVLMQRGYALEDLSLSASSLQSQIMAGAGASGVRTTSGSVKIGMRYMYQFWMETRQGLPDRLRRCLLHLD